MKRVYNSFGVMEKLEEYFSAYIDKVCKYGEVVQEVLCLVQFVSILITSGMTANW